jgi:S1-C subfamily serine protease
MRLHRMLIAAFAATLTVPAAGAAQDDCPCRRPGIIGVMFSVDEGPGVRIREVRPGSPADGAGIRPGDVVIRVNGTPAAEGIPRLPERLQAGDTVRLRVTRADAPEREVVVIAAARPDDWGTPAAGGRERRTIVIHGDSLEHPLRELSFRIDSLNDRLLRIDSAGFRVRVDSIVRFFADSAGIRTGTAPGVRVQRMERMPDGVPVPGDGRPFFLEVGRRAAAGAELAPMNEGLARYFGGQRSGALVIEVGTGSPAERAGLQAGDIIVQAGGRSVASPDDVRRELTPRAGSIPLQVIRQGRRLEIALEWSGAREERIFFRQP